MFDAFLGAIFAFLFAFIFYIYQKKSQDGHYLSFTISYAASQVGKLYSFKRDVIERRDNEISNLEKEFESQKPHLQIKEISQFISNASHSSESVNIEKLSFIADYDPNLILLTKASLDADKDINKIIEGCNEQIKETKKDLNPANIWLLMSYNKNLSDQIDYALALMEHCQKQLIEFSKQEYKYFTDIRGVVIVDEFKKYKPNIENTLLTIKYMSKNRNCIYKIKRIFNRFRTCL